MTKLIYFLQQINKTPFNKIINNNNMNKLKTLILKIKNNYNCNNKM